MKQLSAIVLILVLICLNACAPTESVETALLRVGMDARIGRPLVYATGEQGFAGFEVDICKYVADKLERKLEIVNADWPQLPTLLRKKKVDLVLSAIERPLDGDPPEDLAFTAHYYTAYQQLTVLKSDDYSYNLSDLKEKKLGVVQGAVGVLLIEELNRLKNTNIELVTYETPEAVFQALKNKELAAALTERAFASWYAWKDDDLKLTGEPITNEIPYVGLVHQENSQLLSQINKILQSAREDQAFRDIFDTWHVSIKR